MTATLGEKDRVLVGDKTETTREEARCRGPIFNN